jgi:hypothetical protein
MSVSEDGVAAMSGDWVTSIYPLADGVARFDGDDLCLEFGERSYCGPVLRNPGGTRVYENEYIWVLRTVYGSEPFPFSVMD